MANIFLDTNKIIDLIIRKPEIGTLLSGHQSFYSPLSAHILCYTEKVKIPSKDLIRALNKLVCVNLKSNILEQALLGPTKDLEDNIQLHSAVEANCDIFLTNDKKLLKMVYFGKTKIVSEI